MWASRAGLEMSDGSDDATWSRGGGLATRWTRLCCGVLRRLNCQGRCAGDILWGVAGARKGQLPSEITLAAGTERRIESFDRGHRNLFRNTTSQLSRDDRLQLTADAHHGTRSTAAAAVADSASCCQCSHPTHCSNPTPPAPWRCLDTDPLSASPPLIGRHLEWHPQCCPQEEDIIRKEALTVPGWQGVEGYHIAEPMFVMRKGQEAPHIVPILRGWYVETVLEDQLTPHSVTDIL